MAIEKSKDDITELELDVITKIPDTDVEVERIQQNRFTNDKGSCNADRNCLQTCPKRSATFIREHTFLKRDSARMTCPNCLCGVETIVERRNTSTTHLSALMLLPICLCVLPYCSKVLRDSVHRCPACGIHLGAKFASGRDAFVICLGNQQPSEVPDQDLVVAPNSDAQFF